MNALRMKALGATLEETNTLMNRGKAEDTTMRTYLTVISALLVIGFAVPASGDTYEQIFDIYEYGIGAQICWSHTYDHSADPIQSATLTIVADDVDGPGSGMDGEQDPVYFAGHYLGLLDDMGYYTNWGYHPGPGNPDQPLTTTVFALDPSWFDSLPVEVVVESGWGVEIETSTLTVIPVPEPATLSLLGLAGLAALRRRRPRFAANVARG